MCNCTGGIVSTSGIHRRTVVKKNTKSKSKLNCPITAKQLQELDKKVIKLIKLDRKDQQLKDSSTHIRGWIKDMKYECPNPVELQVIKEFIENEYNNIAA